MKYDDLSAKELRSLLDDLNDMERGEAAAIVTEVLKMLVDDFIYREAEDYS